VPPFDTGRAVEIGQRAGDTQHPVISARRETQSLCGPQQQRSATRLGARDLIEQCPVRFGVGTDAPLSRKCRIACHLSAAGCSDATSDHRAPLGGRRQSKIRRRHSGDVDMKIDTVEQRTRKPRLIIYRAARCPAARGLGEMTAAARVHGRHQLESCRVRYMPLGTGDANATGFERLAQRFECRAVELRNYVADTPLRVFTQAKRSVVRQSAVVAGDQKV